MPRLISACEAVWLSHLTKYDCCGVRPAKAPMRKRSVRKPWRALQIRAHNVASLGSKTTHCVPREMLSSIKRASRRTGMYFHSEAKWSAPISVRAPHTTLPCFGITRRQLTANAPSAFISEWISNGCVCQACDSADFADRPRARGALICECGVAPIREGTARRRQTVNITCLAPTLARSCHVAEICEAQPPRLSGDRTILP